jgi:hypothetical protein
VGRYAVRILLTSARKGVGRFLRKLDHVSPSTLAGLRLRSALSRKVKIGFGPIKTGERDLNVRKWRIDPVVSYINKHSDSYVADVFWEGDRLDRFSIIVLVKSYSDDLVHEVLKAKARGQIVVFDVVDNPLGCKRSIYDDEEIGGVPAVVEG